jgi:hypothetical protein
MSDSGGHWYLRDGSPCHQVANKTGGKRDFNLRWDRRLKAVPSVTTVLRVIDKEALNNWRVEQGILAALTLPRIPDEPELAYLERVKQDSRQQSQDAAAEGTRIHCAVDDHFSGRDFPEKYQPHVKATLVEIARLFPNVNDWVSEKSFAHPLGFGGSCDLHSTEVFVAADHKGKDGELWTDGDHVYARLTQDGEVKDKRCDYDQNWQLAPYLVGLGLADPNEPSTFKQAAAIFISRTHPGSVSGRIFSAAEMYHGWRIFAAALQLWKLLKNYDGAF